MNAYYTHTQTKLTFRVPYAFIIQKRIFLLLTLFYLFKFPCEGGVSTAHCTDIILGYVQPFMKFLDSGFSGTK